VEVAEGLHGFYVHGEAYQVCSRMLYICPQALLKQGDKLPISSNELNGQQGNIFDKGNVQNCANVCKNTQAPAGFNPEEASETTRMGITHRLEQQDLEVFR